MLAQCTRTVWSINDDNLQHVLILRAVVDRIRLRRLTTWLGRVTGIGNELPLPERRQLDRDDLLLQPRNPVMSTELMN